MTGAGKGGSGGREVQSREVEAREVEVRAVTPEEWVTLREVRLAALADSPQAFASTLERELGFGEQRWRSWIESSSVFLAWRDGQPVGMAAGVADDARRADSVPGSWHVVAMWVRPQERGRGSAGKIIEAVAERARASGAARLVLWVTDVNPRAGAFYERLGFRRTGVRQLVRPGEPDHWEEQLIRELG
jgi:GNAT superfamily N-acetyltransferase